MNARARNTGQCPASPTQRRSVSRCSREPEPTPGGGTAAAIAGAMGAALLTMVAGLAKPRTGSGEERGARPSGGVADGRPRAAGRARRCRHRGLQPGDGGVPAAQGRPTRRGLPHNEAIQHSLQRRERTSRVVARPRGHGALARTVRATATDPRRATYAWPWSCSKPPPRVPPPTSRSISSSLKDHGVHVVRRQRRGEDREGARRRRRRRARPPRGVNAGEVPKFLGSSVPGF